MFSKDLFLVRYVDLHDRIIPNIIESQPEEVLRTTSFGGNSILWIYWHMLRTEDVGLSRFILDEDQLYNSFRNIVGVNTTLNGTGMNMDDVYKTTSTIILEGLKSYREAVKSRTMNLISSVEQIDLSEILTKERIEEVICKEEIMPEDSWNMLPLYYGKSKEWFLLHVSLTHPFYHLGQISTMAKLYNK